MSNTYVLPAYAGFGQPTLLSNNAVAERSVLAGPDRRETGFDAYAPRRGAEAARPVAPPAMRPARGARQAQFYRLRVRGRWFLGLRRARERASNPAVPPLAVAVGF